MQLLIKRSKRQGGVFGGKQLFSSYIRAQYTEEERANINNNGIGGEILYSSQAAQQHIANIEQGGLVRGLGQLALAKMNLNISIASLQKGHQIDCPDLGELLECENAVIDACKNLKNYLEAAKAFDGREIVVDIDES